MLHSQIDYYIVYWQYGATQVCLIWRILQNIQDNNIILDEI